MHRLRLEGWLSALKVATPIIGRVYHLDINFYLGALNNSVHSSPFNDFENQIFSTIHQPLAHILPRIPHPTIVFIRENFRRLIQNPSTYAIRQIEINALSPILLRSVGNPHHVQPLHLPVESSPRFDHQSVQWYFGSVLVSGCV